MPIAISIDEDGVDSPGAVARVAPAYAAAYLAFEEATRRTAALDEKMVELILLAVDASVTRLDEAGMRTHIKAALRSGATKDEISEVLQLASVLGIHTCTVGLPALLTELELAGLRSASNDLSSEQVAVRDGFIARRGYWAPFLNALLELDQEFLDAYTAFSSVPWEHGVLAPKDKELIYIAIDAATTHLYEPGLRAHIRNALGHGATADEILATLEVISLLGHESSRRGMPILEVEARTFDLEISAKRDSE